MVHSNNCTSDLNAWVDVVTRGPMLRQVSGVGSLVPEDIRWVASQTAGRVERIEILPGAKLEPASLAITGTPMAIASSTLFWMPRAMRSGATTTSAAAGMTRSGSRKK